MRQEAIDNVKRLRNHPSIVIWVGNNEIETAWKHWGWKEQLPASLWDDYLKIFHGVLPEVCELAGSVAALLAQFAQFEPGRRSGFAEDG